MYTDLYNSIKTIIEAGNLGFAKIDWFNNQYQKKYNDDAAEGFPACYLQFMPMQWEEESDGVENTDVTVIFHIVTHQLGDDPTVLMTLAKNFNNHLRGKADMQLANTYPILSPMRKVTSDYIPMGNLKVFKLGFKAVYSDAVPDQYSQDVNGDYTFVAD